MNREIKFRIFDKKNKKMIKSNDYDYEYDDDATMIGIDGQIIKASQYDGFYVFQEDQYILMQYTGLKDANGKEIYEGDIMMASLYGNQYKGIVEDDDIQPSFIIKNISNGNTEYDFSKCEMMHYEVIGNIYENTELLEKTIEDI